MRIEIVNIEDVYPIEDEYGNQFLSRDYSTKANREYVKELAKSFGPNGEPDEPPVLIEDGSIWRIKAGNSRVMAMREVGTKRFTAFIDEDNTVKSLVEAAIRTNTKKKYEPIEESRFVQQLTMFGDDEYVAKTAGIDVEKAKRIRKGRDRVDDAAEDMTLWRLEAIGEFADNPDAVAELTNCAEKEYPAIAAKYRAERDRATKDGEIVKALKDRGIDIGDVSGMRLVKTFSDASKIPDELPDGCVAARHQVPGFFCVFAPATGDIEDGEEEKKAMRTALAERYKQGAQRREEWLAEHIADESSTSGLAALVIEEGARFGDPTVRQFAQRHDITSEHLLVGGGEIIAMFVQLNESAYGVHDYECNPSPTKCKKYIALMDAMEAGGYEPDETEQGIYQQATDCLEEK